MTHLTPDELIDAMEGLLAADRRAHLDACGECQETLASLSKALGDAKEAGVPEPSPLFWQHFSERVATAIHHETAPGVNGSSWLRWQILMPLGAVAMILLALVVSVSRQAAAPAAPVAPAASVAPASSDNWAMVSELVGNIDLDVASAAGVIEPGVAEEAVLQLSAEERQELTRLLKAELQRAKS